jgi:hypothetical protein
METFESPTTLKNGNHILTPAKLCPAKSCICNYHNAMHTQKLLKRHYISQTFLIISVLTHIHTSAKCCICTMPVQVMTHYWPNQTWPLPQKNCNKKIKAMENKHNTYKPSALPPNSRAYSSFVILQYKGSYMFNTSREHFILWLN